MRALIHPDEFLGGSDFDLLKLILFDLFNSESRQCAFRSSQTNFALHSDGVDSDLLKAKESCVNALCDQPR